MLRSAAALFVMGLTCVISCRSPAADPVERVDGASDMSGFSLRSLKGTRDGARLDVEAEYGDGARNIQVVLQFDVTPPARLVSGTWTGLDGSGQVQQRSVTFLGGQAGAPSIGGRFDLIGPDSRPLYRITIPLQELSNSPVRRN